MKGLKPTKLVSVAPFRLRDVETAGAGRMGRFCQLQPLTCHGAGLPDRVSAEASSFGRSLKASRCLARDASHFVRLKMRFADPWATAPFPAPRKDKICSIIHTVEIEWAGRPLMLETGKIARQADGAVLATYGETVVLATVVSAKSPKPGQDFFPLTVNYQEKTYAAGKIPGGYFKREGRPSENETLVSRLIDRPIRPLFAEGYKNDTQVVVTVMQHDLENNPDILSMVATSAALTLSGVPFMGPIGGARVGYINGEYSAQPASRRDGRNRASTSLLPARRKPC